MIIPNDIEEYINKRWKWDADIRQELIVEILELPEGSHINKSWCVSRYKSRCIDNSRVRSNRSRLELDNYDSIVTNLSLKGQGDDPLDILVAEEEVKDRLELLSPLLRATLEEVSIKGRTPEEVAEASNTTANVIYKRIHDARQTLQGNNQ